jgi:ATPase subunit of ABC transporter with duplicated ATPase domains
VSPFHSVSFSLVAAGITVARGAQVVLDGVNVAVAPRSRLGVVGPNGVGKSTLLHVLTGIETPDLGTVQRTPPDLHVADLAQEDHHDTETVGSMLARRSGTAEIAAALDGASAALATGGAGADEAYAQALDAYLGAGCADFDARVAVAVGEVGLAPDLVGAPLGRLSGGQRARAALAAVLLLRADVVLLDEPTNDLDFEGLEILERFLVRRPGGMVVVSHDRAFLERTVTSVLELDEHTHQGTLYDGGWGAYLDARAVTRRHAQEDYATYQVERTRLRERSQRQREWATQGTARAKRDGDERDKYIRQFKVASSERLAAKARATDRALERLPEVAKPWEGWDLHFEIAPAPRSGAIAMRLTDAVVERGQFRLGPTTLEVGWADRVALVGRNGSGKTTLLETLLGRVPLAVGTRWVGPSVVIGELEQDRRQLTGSATLLDLVRTPAGITVAEVRSQLAKFGLGAEHLGRPAASLSPGERTRAVLAEFALRGVNCLVLDEPSNHLDLPAIEELEAALQRYSGTLLLVTHDRALLEHVSTTRTFDLHDGTVDEA